MKATTIQLTPSSQTRFDVFHSQYKRYFLIREEFADAEADMKGARKVWESHNEEFARASGKSPVVVVSDGGEMLAKFAKARVVNDLDKRAYIDAVLADAGVDETTRTTITGMLSATKLLDEIAISFTRARKQHPDELEEHNSPENKGPRTVEFL